MNIENETDIRLKELVELAKLYDIYGPLMNDHSSGIFEDYILNDLSLSEIASEVDLSRQGVRDIIVRCSKKLRDYEAKLGFAARLDKCSAALDRVNSYIGSAYPSDKELSEQVNEIRTILDI